MRHLAHWRRNEEIMWLRGWQKVRGDAEEKKGMEAKKMKRCRERNREEGRRNDQGDAEKKGRDTETKIGMVGCRMKKRGWNAKRSWDGWPGTRQIEWKCKLTEGVLINTCLCSPMRDGKEENGCMQECAETKKITGGTENYKGTPKKIKGGNKKEIRGKSGNREGRGRRK